MNYFELFGLPVAPTVDRSVISKKYIELQKKYHPDFFSNAGTEEQDDVLLLSADVNKAYKTFQSPDKTIAYFLQTIGMLEEGEKYALPPDFLMEMMEINETLTENKNAQGEIKKNIENLLEEIQPVLQNYSAANTVETDLQKLKEYYYKKKYLQRILDRLAD